MGREGEDMGRGSNLKFLNSFEILISYLKLLP